MNGNHTTIKVNLGCGKNKLDGWSNYDADLDITRPLPFGDECVDFILAEHVVEHIDYYQAVGFFKECFRVLKDNGVVRIAVPSVERVLRNASPEYLRFASKWAPTPDLRGAMHAMLYAHGHRAPWTESLLCTSLYFVGFGRIEICSPGQSHIEELQNVEGHGRVIGEYFNWIETTVAEATKQGD